MATLRLHRHGASPLEVTQDRMLVGREPTCDLVVEDKSVSRRHAYFENRGSVWFVVDQGSANGTFVNGAQVTEAALYDGQELRLGMVPLRVEIESAMMGTVLMGAPAQGTVLMGGGAGPAMAPPVAAPQPPPQSWGAPPQAYAQPSAPAYAPPAPAYAPPPPAYAAPAAAEYTPSPQDEAAALLGVHPHAGADEVKARYTELASDLEGKLTTARTPNLKATYERNLNELRKAAELLSPGFTTVDVADLPAAAPTVIPDELDMSIPAPVRAAMVEKPPEAAEPRSGLPATSTVTLGFIAMGLLAMIMFFSLSAGKDAKNRAKVINTTEVQKARQDATKYKEIEALAAANILTNAPLKMCNKGTQSYELAWLGAVYATTSPDTGRTVLRNFNSGFCGTDFKYVIGSGAEQAIQANGSSDKCKWDGKALYMAAAFKHPTDPEKLMRVSASLANRTDCVPFGEGW